MSDHERPCGCLFKGYEVVSQCVYHTRRRRLIESLQRENEDLRRIASEKHDEVLALEAAAITPEMREVLKRAFALAREIEDRELAEDLCGLLVRTDPKQARLNTGGEG